MENKLELAYDYYLEDNDKAYALFLECAKDDYVDAQLMVAYMLSNDMGINKNLEQSYYWYKKAADNGHIPSSSCYAYYCFDNNDFPEGQKYLEKAVNREDINAIYNMAIYTLNGMYGYEKDEEKAIRLFNKAVLLGDVESYAQIWIIQAKKLGKKKAWKYLRYKFGFFPIWKLYKLCFVRYIKKIFKK